MKFVFISKDLEITFPDVGYSQHADTIIYWLSSSYKHGHYDLMWHGKGPPILIRIDLT